jgi:Spy/CpxP family protein refolding chaperone
MTKAKLILIIAFVVALAAGVVVGFTIRSLPHRPHNRFPDLKLTAEQKTQMHEIWSAVMRNSLKLQDEQRQAFQKQRDKAIRAILTDEQKAKYDEALKHWDSESKKAELDKALENAREKAFQEAVEKTKPILNAEQRKKYEEWLKSRREERHPGGPPPQPMKPPPTHAEEHTATGSGT